MKLMRMPITWHLIQLLNISASISAVRNGRIIPHPLPPIHGAPFISDGCGAIIAPADEDPDRCLVGVVSAGRRTTQTGRAGR